MAKSKDAPTQEAVQEPTKEAVQKGVKNTPKAQSPFAVSETPEVPETKEEISDVLDLESLGEKKLKVKVNGEEREATLADVLKGYQLEQSANQKFQQISERDKAIQAREVELKALEEKLFNQESQPFKGAEVEISEDDKWVYDALKPVLDQKEAAYQQRIDALEAQLNQVAPVIQSLQPMVVDGQFKQAHDLVQKENPAFNDLLDSRAELEQRFTLLPPERQSIYNDGVNGIVRLYKDMKLEQLAKGGTSAVNNAPPSVNVEPASGSTPAGKVDDTELYYKELASAREKALHGGTLGNFQDLLKMKLGAKL